MKKKILLFVVITIAFLTLSGCFTFDGVESLSINYQLKERYDLNEEVLLDNIIVTATMTQGNPQSVAFNNDDVIKIAGYRLDGGRYYLLTDTAGQHTLKISFGGVIFEVDYQVISDALWDGTSYEEPLIDPNNANTYLVSKPAHLAWISRESFNEPVDGLYPFDGMTIKIISDLDMGNKPNWKPINYLNNVIIDGDKNQGEGDVVPVQISNLPSGFINVASKITVKNLILNYNIIKEKGFGGLFYYLRGKNYGDEMVESYVDNVEITGKVFATGSVSSFVTYGCINHPTIKETLHITNSKSTLNLSTSAESNSALLFGYPYNIHITTDKYLWEKSTGDFKILETSANHLYIGNTTGMSLEIEGYEGTINKSTFGSALASVFPDGDTNDDYGIISVTERVFDNSQIGSYVSAEKAQNATTILVSLTYLIGQSYDRSLTTKVDVSSAAGVILLPVKFVYVSDNPNSINWVNYVYNDEHQNLDSAGKPYDLVPNSYIVVKIVQLDSQDNVIQVEQYNYLNIPERP